VIVMIDEGFDLNFEVTAVIVISPELLHMELYFSIWSKP